MQNIVSFPLAQLAATLDQTPHAMPIAGARSHLSVNMAALSLFEVKCFQEFFSSRGALLYPADDRVAFQELLVQWSDNEWTQATLQVFSVDRDTQTESLLDLTAWRICLEQGPAIWQSGFTDLKLKTGSRLR